MTLPATPDAPRLFDEPMSRRRPIAGDQWDLPARVELAGDRLLWTLREKGRPVRRGAPSDALLDWFVRLHAKPAEVILNFARTTGVLMLCRHRLPSTHRRATPPLAVPIVDASKPVPAWYRKRAMFGRCVLREVKPWVYWESVEEWRRWSRRAHAVLTLASAVHANDIGPREEWSRFIGNAERVPSSIADARLFLAWEVEGWLRWADVQPTLTWGPKGPAITLGSRSLFGALAIQIMLAVGRSKGIALCSGCGTPYTPQRRIAPNERHYCLSCGERVAQRDASQALRERRRHAKALAREGLSAREIAARMSKPIGRVRQWLR